jgi:hypothetical protein
VKFEIIELEELTGDKAVIYSVHKENDAKNLFDQFVDEYKESHKKELQFLLKRLQTIGQVTGAREIFFKTNEGKPGDGVCALYDEPDTTLRLYCIRYGNCAVILGSGGPKNTRSWQQDDKLDQHATDMIAFSQEITQALREGEIRWDSTGMRLEGELIINNDSDEY